MGLSSAEVPIRPDSRESLPVITKNNKSLYQLVLWFLGLALLALIVGWLGLSVAGLAVPDGVPVVVATIVGALVGVLSTNKQPG